jgi:hypothetical protein
MPNASHASKPGSAAFEGPCCGRLSTHLVWHQPCGGCRLDILLALEDGHAWHYPHGHKPLPASASSAAQSSVASPGMHMPLLGLGCAGDRPSAPGSQVVEQLCCGMTAALAVWQPAFYIPAHSHRQQAQPPTQVGAQDEVMHVIQCPHCSPGFLGTAWLPQQPRRGGSLPCQSYPSASPSHRWHTSHSPCPGADQAASGTLAILHKGRGCGGRDGRGAGSNWHMEIATSYQGPRTRTHGARSTRHGLRTRTSR